MASIVEHSKREAAEVAATAMKEFGSASVEGQIKAAEAVASARREQAATKAAVDREMLQQKAQETAFNQAMKIAEGLDPNLEYKTRMLEAARLAAEMQAIHTTVLAEKLGSKE